MNPQTLYVMMLVKFEFYKSRLTNQSIRFFCIVDIGCCFGDAPGLHEEAVITLRRLYGDEPSLSLEARGAEHLAGMMLTSGLAMRAFCESKVGNVFLRINTGNWSVGECFRLPFYL